MSDWKVGESLEVAKARLEEATNWHQVGAWHDEDAWCCKREQELRDELAALEMAQPPATGPAPATVEVCGMCGGLLSGDYCAACDASVDGDARDLVPAQPSPSPDADKQRATVSSWGMSEALTVLPPAPAVAPAMNHIHALIDRDRDATYLEIGGALLADLVEFKRSASAGESALREALELTDEEELEWAIFCDKQAKQCFDTLQSDGMLMEREYFTGYISGTIEDSFRIWHFHRWRSLATQQTKEEGNR